MVIVWIRFVKSYHRRTALFFDTEAKKPPAAFCVDRGAHLVYSDTRREGQPLSISTSNLLFFLSRTSDLLSFFQKYEDELIKETPGGCLYALLDKYGLRPGDISARTGTGNYVYRILNDERTPGRDTVVAFCLAIGSTLSEPDAAAHQPPRPARSPLSPRWRAYLRPRKRHRAEPVQ